MSFDGWITCQISAICKFQNGYAFKSSQFCQDGDYKVIKIKELKDGKVVFFSDTATVNANDNEYVEYEVTTGDILFALTGDPVSKSNPLSWVGRVSRYAEKEVCLLNQRVCVAKPDNESLERNFLYYHFRGFENFFELASKATGSASQANISTKTIGDTIINLPPLPEQKAIAAVLSALDDKIELNNRINKNLEAQAQAIFKSWFVDFEPFQDGEFVESELGLIPKGWEVSEIGKLPITVTDYVANGSFASLKANVTLYSNPEYAFFMRNTDLKCGIFNTYIDRHAYDFLNKTKLFGGEVIISNVGDVGSVHLCPDLSRPMSLGNNVLMLNSDKYNLYLYRLFNSVYGQYLLDSITGGSAQPKFNKTDFRGLKITVPNNAVLAQYYKINNTLQNLISVKQKENHTLAALRDTLLPKLMSGEIRVPLEV